jgi:hypothetical protein
MASAPATLESTTASSNTAQRAGWGLSGIVIAFLVMDSTMKLLALPVVTQASAALGWPDDAGTARLLGALLLSITVLYALRRTPILGAILLTGYLGGAVATHARIGSPLLTHTLFGVYLGVLAWGGLYLRKPKLRELLGN